MHGSGQAAWLERLEEELGFRGVPVGIEIHRVVETRTTPIMDIGVGGKAGGQSETEQFDVSDPRVRTNLERFLANEKPTPVADDDVRMDSRALSLFAQGVEHPERFWPVIDRDWQEAQLVKEGYDKPLP
jgi:hypothetical protein